ncbi:hypothetical protein RvY_11178 [Ramazzottius varieornatus]|uniref:Uncharacterized protein n=1 Tax=Ramazzottius varieornatus TaxID=947166 RepID=A0A1D1VF94_RAMVA|nr:hypothetical protein RvY_11178 [Ramazzottius varieornatus]
MLGCIMIVSALCNKRHCLAVTRVRRDCGSVDHLFDTLFVNDARGPNGTAGCPIGGTVEHEKTPVCMCSTENNCNSVLMSGQRPLTNFAVEASTPLPSPSSSRSGNTNPGPTVTLQAAGDQTSTTVNNKPTAGSAGSSTAKLSATAVVTIICVSMAFIIGF